MLPTDDFLWAPPAERLAIGIGTRHGRSVTDEGIGALDGSIGSEGESRSGPCDAGPGVGTIEPVGTQARFGHKSVAGLMDGLEGGDDPVRAEQGYIDGIDDLGVLDAPTQVAGIAVRHFVHGGKGVGVSRCPDSVDRRLEPALRRPNQGVPQGRRTHQRQAGVIRIVGIRLLQPCPARTQRPVEIKLNTIQP